jgi:hypothetical protein
MTFRKCVASVLNFLHISQSAVSASGRFLPASQVELQYLLLTRTGRLAIHP